MDRAEEAAGIAAFAAGMVMGTFMKKDSPLLVKSFGEPRLDGPAVTIQLTTESGIRLQIIVEPVGED